MFRTKVCFNDRGDVLGMKCLARKDIEIHVVGLFHEMCSDVGGLDQLHESISLLVASAKQNDLRLSVGHHVDFGHEIF